MRRLVVLVSVIAACGGSGAPDPTAIDPASSDAPTTVLGLVVPGQLEGLAVTSLTVGERELVVAVADTSALRSVGLMFISDLDDLDGMVFVYPSDTDTTFHMENTLIPLDIAWFAADGSFVSKTTMAPCDSDDCPSYAAEARYRYAIEVPAGGFDWIDETSVLDVAALSG